MFIQEITLKVPSSLCLILNKYSDHLVFVTKLHPSIVAPRPLYSDTDIFERKPYYFLSSVCGILPWCRPGFGEKQTSFPHCQLSQSHLWPAMKY